MTLSQAPVLLICQVESEDFPLAARVVALIGTETEHRLGGMKTAVVEEGPIHVLKTSLTFEQNGEAENLVVYLFPRHGPLLLEVQDEFVEVEASVDHVLDDDLTIAINEDLLVGLAAHEVLLL